MAGIIDRQVVKNYGISLNKETVLNELLNYFSTFVPQKLNDAKLALKEQDYRKLKFLLHSAQNSFLNVGSMVVASDCRKLEDEIGKISDEQIDLALSKIENDYFRVKAEFQTLVEEEISVEVTR